MSEFSILIEPGIIGNYNSAKVTLIILHNRKSKENTLVFARLHMQDRRVEKGEPSVTRQNLNDEYGFAIIEYDLELSQTEKIYDCLLNEGNWSDPFEYPLTTDKGLKALDRKYTGPFSSNRENKFLSTSKNGSYWLEFFNEAKQTVSLVYDPYRDGLLEKMAPVIKKHCQIDFEKVRDRIGNIVFQFPVTILDIQLQVAGEQATIDFDWQIPNEGVPSVYIQADSKEENSLIDFIIEPYSGQQSQAINIKLFDTSLRVRILRKNPDLVLHEWNCDCGRITGIHGTFTRDQPTIREFYIENQLQRTTLHFPNGAFNGIHHLEHSKMAIARLSSEKSFRQFEAGQHEEAVSYLRNIVQQSRAREILMIDPYLMAVDILNILYFNPLFGRPLRAIGSATAEIPGNHTTSSTDETIQAQKTRAATKIAQQRAVLSDPRHNNLGLNLEFRMQYGSYGMAMHDRFLLFPGSPENHSEPQAFSIGTSFNGVGKSYHIIGALEGAQSIIDDFEKQWKMLNHSDCLVFKYPNSII